jgi:hypothetical protein
MGNIVSVFVNISSEKLSIKIIAGVFLRIRIKKRKTQKK